MFEALGVLSHEFGVSGIEYKADISRYQVRKKEIYSLKRMGSRLSSYSQGLK